MKFRVPRLASVPVRGFNSRGTLATVILLTFAATSPWRLGGIVINRLTVPLAAIAVIFLVETAVSRRRRLEIRDWILGLDPLPGFRRRVTLLALAALAFFLAVTADRWRALAVNAWDFSLHLDRPIEQTLHGRILWSDFLGTSQLGNHASFLLLAFVPLYAIVATPVWLLLAHAIALAGAVVAAFLLARRILGDDRAALCAAIGLALNSFTARIAQYAVHIEAFYPALLLGLLWALFARRNATFWILLGLIILVKEDAVLPLAGIALIAFARRAPGRALAVLSVAALAYIINDRIILPHFGGTAAGAAWYAPYWGAYGASSSSALSGMFRHPLRVFGDLWRSGVRGLVESLGFLPLVAPVWLAAALPAAIICATAAPRPVSSLSLYYSAPLLPLLFAAALAGVARIGARGVAEPSPTNVARVRIAAVVMLLVCAFDGAGYRFLDARPERSGVADAVQRIGPGPGIIQGSLLPRAGYVRNLRVLQDAAVPRDVPAILVAPETDPYPLSREAIHQLVQDLAHDPRFVAETPGPGLRLFLPRS